MLGHVLFARDAVAEEALLHLIELGERELCKHVEPADEPRRDRHDVQAAAQPCPARRWSGGHGWEEPVRLVIGARAASRRCTADGWG